MRTVLIDGRVVMRDRQLLGIDERAVIAEADRQVALLKNRAGV